MTIAEIPIELTADMLGTIGRLGLYLQAIGLIVIAWLTIQVIDIIIQFKMKKRLKHVEKELSELKSILLKNKKQK